MREYTVQVPIAQVSESASETAHCTSEALYGECISVIQNDQHWAQIVQAHDGYKGYMKLHTLTPSNIENGNVTATTHWVSQRSTLLFHQADLKSPIAHRIPFASELSLTHTDHNAFSKTACGYFVWTDHCLPMDLKHNEDPITLAKTLFLGAPYRWGGRSPEGLDCSGVIQLLARSQGVSIPRDSADQEVFIERQLAADDYQRGDIVYWSGHTGILVNDTTLLHATAFTLSCILEPLSDVIKRAGPISSTRRLFS